ncbi:PadR family transcriptional regulator [Paenibacillus antri]|uniref:PadR family transcriptional regulator n=1 Tax=Paenibacillus antri TaxID=2582848 RepID=A0A5R9GK27_9BACL|nr:PadR family transcriptional regulator [Paenibacillus antri]TLS53798.1 PadR family transcriptional regulator [Paenibacillus antri]
MRYYDHRAWPPGHPGRKRFDKEEGSQERRHRHGGGSRGGHGGRGEGKRFFERGKFKYALLELLAGEPMHGYQLIKAMEEKTGGLYAPSPGSVYPNLQLLEDMQLIGSSETDGKKLYHITEEGRAVLREKGSAAEERSELGWEDRGRHRPRGGGFGKHHLRGFMKEWSDVIFLMSNAAEAAKTNPSSKQAKEFQALMTEFQERLKKLAEPVPPATPPQDDLANDNGE